jgi:hypothetical protein
MANKKIRPIRIEGNIAYVPLTQGYEAVIDAADAPMVEGFNWHAHVERSPDGSARTVYAERADYTAGKRRSIRMHRVISKTPDGLETDHEDGDGLNNRRGNLRPATTTQNKQNRRISPKNKSGVKGVRWREDFGKWQACIKANGTRTSLGSFNCKTAAAIAYAKASEKLHGRFGRLA